MKFLMDYQLTDEDILMVEEFNSKNVLNNIKNNIDNVRESIDYLLSLGITSNTLKDLFVYQIGIFFRSVSELKEVFDEYEIDSVVKSLNYDVNTIDLIEFK